MCGVSGEGVLSARGGGGCEKQAYLERDTYWKREEGIESGVCESYRQGCAGPKKFAETRRRGPRPKHLIGGGKHGT